MLKAKDWVLVIGVAVSCMGLLCIPLGQEANPKRPLSLFTRFVDAGSFLSIGFVLLAIGLLIVCVSFFLPRR